MELKPVFLLAPEPDPRPDRPALSRRALLAGLLGTAAGGAALGWFLRGTIADSPPSTPAPMNAALVWALALQDAPIANLERESLSFLAVVVSTRSTALRNGVTRLAEWAMTDRSARSSDRAELARRIEALASDVPELDLPNSVLRALHELR